MSGIYALWSKQVNRDTEPVYTYFFSHGLENIKNQEIICQQNDFTAGRSNRDLPDRFLHESDRYITALEGVVYEGCSGSDELIERWKKSPDNFPYQITGHYCGFIFDKAEQQLVVFTDALSSRPLYWYANQESQTFMISSEAAAIARYLQSEHVQLHPDADAFRALLSFGYMFFDQTPAREIRKVDSGSVWAIDLNTFSIQKKRWFGFDEKPGSDSKTAIIDTIDSLLEKRISQEWQKDRVLQKKHLALLSGGLDSRVNVLMAEESGFSPIHTVTFSQSGMPDQLIAGEIADRKNFRHSFIPLDDGQFIIENMEETQLANDGLVNFLGACHLYSSLKPLRHQEYGLLHTGQIGDVVFGSFSGLVLNIKQLLLKHTVTRDGLGIADTKTFTRLLETYGQETTAERFSFEQRQINSILNGDRVISHYMDAVSPFYDQHLLRYALSIPQKLKKDQHIYLEWMQTKRPGFTKYKWEKTGTLPKANLYTQVFGFYTRGKRFLQKKLGMEYEEMNPYQKWMEENVELRNKMNDVFSAHIELVSDSSLKKDIQAFYRHTAAQAKSNAISAALIWKMYGFR